MNKIMSYKGVFYLLLLGGALLNWEACSSSQTMDALNELAVSHSVIQLGKEGGGVQVDVESTLAWTVEADATWISLSRTGAPASAQVQIGAASNPTTEERSANVTIASGDQSAQIVVTQEAGEEDQGGGGGEPDPPLYIEPDDTDMRAMSTYELSQEMGVGWNIGNSLEAIGGETAWGNPFVSEQLIDSVKAAGFNIIRIPVAWSKFSDPDNFIIRKAWLERVEQVVNYVLDNDMYAMVNLHWDNGWIQPLYAEEAYVNNRLQIMWQQIAVHFRDYDDHLLFAGTNEILVEGEYGTPTEENYTVQNGYNQTFVQAVRATGGRNHYRHLVVQGYNTNINHTLSFFQMPEDVVEDRLALEIHYYDPYNFTLNENTNLTQWGSIATNPELTEDWADEDHLRSQFEQLKERYIDNGIAVILGEYGAIHRPQISGHEVYQEYYLDAVTEVATGNGVIPVYWDSGYLERNGMGLFNRATGEQGFPNLIKAIVEDN